MGFLGSDLSSNCYFAPVTMLKAAEDMRGKAELHIAQQVAAMPLQKWLHKFWLLQGTFANGHTPVPP